MKKRVLSLLLALLMILALAPATPANVVAADIGEDIRQLLWLPLDGNYNNASRDAELYTAQGSGTGATFTIDDRFGTVLDLSGGNKGTSGAILSGNLGVSLRTAGALTVSTWVYSRASSNYTRIFDFGRGQTQNLYASFMHPGAGGACAKITTAGSGGEQTVADPSGALSTGQWHHIAVTYDSTAREMKYYRDGILIGEVTTTSTINNLFSATAASNLMYIGRSQYGDSDANCKISDFRVFDAALNGDEIRAYRAAKLTETEVVADDINFLISELGTLTDRTDSFTLPTESGVGSTVVWSSSNNTYLNAATGAVTRPDNTYADPHVSVDLTVTVTNGDTSDSRTVTVTIPRLPSDSDIVEADASAISFESQILRENITLPTSGEMGSTIRWTTNNASVLSNTGVVTRPAIGSPDAAAILTATVSLNAASTTKEFTFTIRAMTATPVLTGLSRVAVETKQGVLPRLPFWVDGIYADSVKGDSIRVNWDVPAGGASPKPTTYDETGVVTQVKTAVRSSLEAKANIFVYSADSYAHALNSQGDFDVLTDVVKTEEGYDSTLRIANESAEDISAKAIVALYDAQGCFVEYKENVNAITAGDNGAVTVTLDDIPEGYSAKVFAWEDGTMVPLAAEMTVEAEEGPALVTEKFALSDVSLNNYENGQTTIFQQNTENMLNELLNINPNTYLYTFRYTYGLMDENPAGTPTPSSWDSYTGKLKGHGTGHYLSGLAQVYESIDEDHPRRQEVLDNMNYMVDELYKISMIADGDPAEVPAVYPASEADKTGNFSFLVDGDYKYQYFYQETDIRKDYDKWGKGYISAYAPDQFVMLERGANYDANTGNSNTLWAPYYTLHKLMNGFINIYTVAGNEKGLEMAENMGLWVHARLSKLDQATLNMMWHKYIAGEYGGMNEVMATLAMLTKDSGNREKFLETAKLFDNVNYFHGANYVSGLANNVDTLRGRHANQHIPQITGALKIFDGSNDQKYFDIADNFWYLMKECYSFSIGGVGGNRANYETFYSAPNALLTGGSTGGCLLTTNVNSCESCGMYNLLKLSTQLFLHDNDTKYMDYYERTLYNGIANGIVKSGSGQNTYPNPLYNGARNSYSGATTGSTCCGGTARESHTKYADSIYFKSIDDSALYVNLFIPSTLNWQRDTGDVNVNMVTNYPYGNTVKLIIGGSGDFTVKTRVPAWATNGYSVTVNGEPCGEGTPDSYMDITRTWSMGDVIEITMPVTWHYDKLNEDTNVRSLCFGPVVMASPEAGASATLRPISLEYNLASSVTDFDQSTLTATIDGLSFKPLTDYRPVGNPSGGNVNGDRRSVYFDVTINE